MYRVKLYNTQKYMYIKIEFGTKSGSHIQPQNNKDEGDNPAGAWVQVIHYAIIMSTAQDLSDITWFLLVCLIILPTVYILVVININRTLHQVRQARQATDSHIAYYSLDDKSQPVNLIIVRKLA